MFCEKQDRSKMKFLDAIIGKEIVNIYTVGFMEIDDGCAEYYPRLEWIYFEFKDIMIEFEAFNQYNQLGMRQVNDVRYLFEIDDDAMYAKSSIKDIVLINSLRMGNVIKDVKLKGETEKCCHAVKIVLENEQVVFIDPYFLYGIGIGGKEQEDYREWVLEE